MLISMTGFATKTVVVPVPGQAPVSITLFIKSLNHRFFESSCKLPHTIAHIEPDLIAICKSRLKRGSIFFTLTLSSSALFKGRVEAAMNTIEEYMIAAGNIQKKFGVDGKLSITDILRLPNTCNVEEKNIDDSLKSIIIRATQELVDDLVRACTQEGTQLEKDILARLEILNRTIEAIAKRAQTVLNERTKNVGQDIAKLMSDASATESQRAILYAELHRTDIHEEITRFIGHLQSMHATIQRTDMEKGKRIEFTLQELVREANTIASKCADMEISGYAIDCKVELEKIREQIQNIV